MPTVKGQIDLDRAVNEHFFGYTESTKLIASLEQLTQYRQPGSWKSQARAEVRQYRPEMQRMLFDLQMFNLGVLRRISCFEKVLEGRKRQLSGIMDARRELLRAGACLPAASLEADWERDEEDCEEIAHYEMLPTQEAIVRSKRQIVFCEHTIRAEYLWCFQVEAARIKFIVSGNLAPWEMLQMVEKNEEVLALVVRSGFEITMKGYRTAVAEAEAFTAMACREVCLLELLEDTTLRGDGG